MSEVYGGRWVGVRGYGVFGFLGYGGEFVFYFKF